MCSIFFFTFVSNVDTLHWLKLSEQDCMHDTIRIMHVTLRFFIIFMSFATFKLAHWQKRKRKDIER